MPVAIYFIFDEESTHLIILLLNIYFIFHCVCVCGVYVYISICACGDQRHQVHMESELGVIVSVLRIKLRPSEEQ